ncbi:hypothetical protein EVAR_55229_1 [Eumeta japonica]|uniref:Uncharacterized protein n=1 Tax=Eumeta variegata TaxID=151549 RepID=A0A4C1ZRF3_EUMVA|nr:hypothetical protein EVAR_55229_1 [Eumeta japonica]
MWRSYVRGKISCAYERISFVNSDGLRCRRGTSVFANCARAAAKEGAMRAHKQKADRRRNSSERSPPPSPRAFFARYNTLDTRRCPTSESVAQSPPARRPARAHLETGPRFRHSGRGSIPDFLLAPLPARDKSSNPEVIGLGAPEGKEEIVRQCRTRARRAGRRGPPGARGLFGRSGECQHRFRPVWRNV